MDKLKKLYEKYLSELLTESKEKLESLPEWKLDLYSSSLSSKSKTEKINHIQEKFLLNDIIYSTLINDLNQFKKPNFKPANLEILSIDDRFLEANGYLNEKKEKIYSFISEVQKLIQE
ncbi:hypothetical protein [uncultured Winogradskyella sp.]|jgi:hypothetical protein|uniref:hypothetical protein n=1 Tax=uncultured Winogradskyella sp. TaxID=395353 RepID=UPI0030D8905A|tara:strand:+ start:2722 stop:3075 length:354 start_codon:yes stop_codon:yes gene_type:complete